MKVCDTFSIMATLLRSSRQLHCLRPSTSTPQRISARFLQLPANLRSRAFHASPRSRFIEESVTLSQTLIQTLHSTTGLPWAYTLPLFAVAVRTTLFLPLAIYVRRVTQRQISLQPIIQSWTHTLRKETIQEVGHLGPQVSHQKLLVKMRNKRIEIYKRWGCQNWKNFTPVIQVPVFVCIMQSIRHMCGYGGMILSTDPATGDSISLIEPSLALEGALWFPNLMLADPYLVLPFVLSGTMLLNVLSNRFRTDRAETRSKFQTRLERVLGTVALAVGPVMLQAPTALLVYWIGSSLAALGQNFILDVVMPVQKPVAACKPKRPWKTGLGAEIMAGKEDVGQPRATNPDAIVPAPPVSSNRRQ